MTRALPTTLLLSTLLLACAKPGGPGVEPRDQGPATTSALTGTVEGEALAGARISVAPASTLEWTLVDYASARADAAGAFELDALAPGGYVACAAGPGATVWQAFERGADGPATVTLQAPALGDAARELRGRVIGGGEGVEVFIGRIDPMGLRYDGCLLDVAADGSFAAHGLEQNFYWLGARAPGRVSALTFVDLRGSELGLELELTPEPHVTAQTLELDGVLAGLRAVAVPLPSPDEPDAAVYSALRQATAGAALIGFGEATHGTREFFTLKHRAFAHMIEHEGVSRVLFELSLAAGEAIDAYVQGGDADLRMLLITQGRAWPWLADEIVALFEWLRAYNLDRPAAERVHVVGIDMQAPDLELAALRAYLERVDPDYAKSIADQLAFPEDPAGVHGLLATLVGVHKRLAEQRERYSKSAGAREWAYARQRLRVIGAAFGDETPNGRDQAMAQTAIWALAEAGPGARAVLWAHSMHMRTGELFGMPMMGEYLRRELGDGYRAIGFGFDRGEFMAFDLSHGFESSPGVVANAVGPAPEASFERVLAQLDGPAQFIDLRRLDGPAAAWASTRQIMRWTGAEFVGERELSHYDVPAQAFDALLFVRESSPSTVVMPARPAG